MDISQIGIKKLLSLVVIILLNQGLIAQKNDSISYRYEIEIIDEDYLNVKVVSTQNASIPLTFKFLDQVPNFYIKEKNDKIIIVDNGGVVQLKENDVLLKLDGVKKIEEIREKLMDKSEKNSCFVVLREGKRKKFKISNKESLFIRSKFNLSFFEESAAEQKENWKKYIY